MPILTFSTANSGAAVADPVDLGARANGQVTTSTTLFIRHSDPATIRNVGFYLLAFAGVYSGGATAAADLAEVRGWGDAAGADNFGGVQINQDAVGGFPDASWPIAGSPTRGHGAVFNSTQGNSSLNTIPLRTASGAAIAGEVPAGAAPNVRVQFRTQVPTSVTVTGVRLFGLAVVYTFTS